MLFIRYLFLFPLYSIFIPFPLSPFHSPFYIHLPFLLLYSLPLYSLSPFPFLCSLPPFYFTSLSLLDFSSSLFLLTIFCIFFKNQRHKKSTKYQRVHLQDRLPWSEWIAI